MAAPEPSGAYSYLVEDYSLDANRTLNGTTNTIADAKSPPAVPRADSKVKGGRGGVVPIVAAPTSPINADAPSTGGDGGGGAKLQYDYGASVPAEGGEGAETTKNAKDGTEAAAKAEDAPAALTLDDYIGLGSEHNSERSMSFNDNSVFGGSASTSGSEYGGDFNTLALVGRKPAPSTASGTGAAAAAATSANTGTGSGPNSKTNQNQTYNPFRDFDFGVLTEPKTPKGASGSGSASNAHPAPQTEAAGFNFGIETFLHGYQLGFGRQPSFKKLKAEPEPAADMWMETFNIGSPKVKPNTGSSSNNNGTNSNGSSVNNKLTFSKPHSDPKGTNAQSTGTPSKGGTTTTNGRPFSGKRTSTATATVKAIPPSAVVDAAPLLSPSRNHPTHSPTKNNNNNNNSTNNNGEDFKRDVDQMLRAYLDAGNSPRNAPSTTQTFNLEAFLNGDLSTRPDMSSRRNRRPSVSHPNMASTPASVSKASIAKQNAFNANSSTNANALGNNNNNNNNGSMSTPTPSTPYSTQKRRRMWETSMQGTEDSTRKPLPPGFSYLEEEWLSKPGEGSTTSRKTNTTNGKLVASVNDKSAPDYQRAWKEIPPPRIPNEAMKAAITSPENSASDTATFSSLTDYSGDGASRSSQRSSKRSRNVSHTRPPVTPPTLSQDQKQIPQAPPKSNDEPMDARTNKKANHNNNKEKEDIMMSMEYPSTEGMLYYGTQVNSGPLPLFPRVAPLIVGKTQSPQSHVTAAPGTKLVPPSAGHIPTPKSGSAGSKANRPASILRRSSYTSEKGKDKDKSKEKDKDNKSSKEKPPSSELSGKRSGARLSELKNGEYWMPSMSKSRLSASNSGGDAPGDAAVPAAPSSAADSAAAAAAASASGRKLTAREERELAEQKANEERRERVRAFMAQRKLEKQQQEEQRRLQEQARREEQERWEAAEQQRAMAAAKSAGSGANVAKAIRKNKASPPERKQPIPAAPYLKEESVTMMMSERTKRGEQIVDDMDNALKRKKSEFRVRSVIIFVKSDSPDKVASDCMTANFTASTGVLEVRYGTDTPHYFGIDEYHAQPPTGQGLKSSTLSELSRKFVAGVNVGLLLSSTASAEIGVFTAMRESLEGISSNKPTDAQLFISVAMVCAGLTEDLLTETGRLDRSTYATSPHLGVTLNDVGFVEVTEQTQFSKVVADAYSRAKFVKGSQSNGMVVISLVLKQMKNDDVVLSSFLITDAGVNTNLYSAVLRRADQSPFALFYGALGGPTYTVALLALGEEDTAEGAQALHTQYRLSSVTNKPHHVGSVKRFCELAEKELANPAKTQDSAKRTLLTTQLEEAKAMLRNPKAFEIKPSPDQLLRSRGNTQASVTKPDNAVFPVAVSRHQQIIHRKPSMENKNNLNNSAPSSNGGELHNSANSATGRGEKKKDTPKKKSSSSSHLSKKPQPVFKLFPSKGEGATHPASPPARNSSAASASPKAAAAAAAAKAKSAPPPLKHVNNAGSADAETSKQGLGSRQNSGMNAPNEYSKRGGSPNGGGNQFMNLDDAPAPSTENKKTMTPAPPAHAPASPNPRVNIKRNGEHKTLPGSTAIGADGPAWPSEPNIEVGDIIEVNSIGGSFSSEEEHVSASSRKGGYAASEASRQSREHGTSPQSIPASTKVRTLVIVDPHCRETSNVTYDNTMVVATTEDDFEEYDVDEVTELANETEAIQSDVLKQLCETVMSGCNAAILGADSRSSQVSPLVMKSVVRSLLSEMNAGTKRGNMSASIVKLKGEMVIDLLQEKCSAQKLVIAISPIFGSCVHGVSYKSIDSPATFDAMVNKALQNATADGGKDYGLVFCSLIVKLRVKDVEDDVLVCSLVASFAGENVGLYNNVLDKSPLVPRALYHYALGGPCYTVALLGIGSDESRANLMLGVQKRLGEMYNRPTHPGSIVKFISGIRNDLAPTLMQRYEQAQDPAERASTKEILDRLGEMVKDAEALLKDFDNHEPKAYLHDDQNQDQDQGQGQENTDAAPQRRSLPAITVKEDADSKAKQRIRSVVCFAEELRGGGSVAVEGNTVLVRTQEGGMRFDSDEVVSRNEIGQLMDSEQVNLMVAKFLEGYNTGMLAADSGNCAFTPLMLRKMAYQIVHTLSGIAPGNGAIKHMVSGELQVSMALIKDDITADLLPVEVDATYHRFEIEHSPLSGPRITGVTAHDVRSTEEFDHFLSVAIDNADPALQTDDPGIMVVSFVLRQRVSKPTDDILVSSLVCTAVFDAVHHYTNVLREDPSEPLELFRNIIGGHAYSIGLFGVSDEDVDAGILLNVLNELAKIENEAAEQNSVAKLIRDLQEGIARLQERRATSSNAQEKEYIMSRVTAAERMMKDAEMLLRYPVVPQQGFVPLGANAMGGGMSND